MAYDLEPTRDAEYPPAALLWLLRVLAMLAMATSLYLAWLAMTASDVAGCTALGWDCGKVLASRWSRWLGVPVGLPAASLFATLLGVLSFAGPLSPPRVRALSWQAAVCLAVLCGGAAVWFVGLQVFVLGEFCLWCMSVHICGLVLAGAILLAGPNAWWAKLPVAAIGLAGVGVLVLGQLFGHFEPPTYAVERVTASPTAMVLRLDEKPREQQGIRLADLEKSRPPKPAEAPPVDNSERILPPPEFVLPNAPRVDESPASIDMDIDDLFADRPDNDHHAASLAPAAEEPSNGKRLVKVLNGRAEVDTHQFPTLGSPDAPHVIVKLFDFTCPHCRDSHKHLTAARRRYGGQLAIVMIPVPMNSDCNPLVQHTHSKHVDACVMAKLALAVWRAEPAAYEPFDTFLFTGEQPPTAAAARREAERLVGADALSDALDDWQLPDRLQFAAQLYKLCDTGAIPKLLIPPQSLVRGDMPQEELFQLLERELGVEPATP